MKETSNKWVKSLQKFFSFFQNERLQKNSRITYGVIWNLFLILFIVCIIGGAFAGGIGAGYFASLVKDEPTRSYAQMKKDIYNYEETSNLYFADNVYLGKVRSDLEREEVKIENVSKYLKDALIATEDKYFYEHNGIVPKALLRAVFQEVTNSSTQTGGSTLTQQIIKNQILTNEVSFDRKAKEVLLALRLEQFFKKDEILEAYMNVSTFGRNSSGQNIGGVESAAKGIFGVSAKDLNLAQSAFIAGLPQSPFMYTPFTNDGKLKSKEGLEPGLNRMKLVLHRMNENGYITDKQYKETINYDIVKDFIKPQKNPLDKYPWLTNEIEQRAKNIIAIMLAEKDGYKEKDLNKNAKLYEKYITLADRNIRQNGYNIHTTINKKIYDNMQKTKDEFKNYGPDKTVTRLNKETGEEESYVEPVQIGGIMIENKTGKILSFVGGRDFKQEQLNHATQGRRPNGSTMKPLLVYAPAMEMGVTAPGTVIADSDTGIRVEGRAWPSNYVTGKYYGLVTTREALAKSHNVTAIKVYQRIINKRPAQYLAKMGFSDLTDVDYEVLSVALGGLTKGVTVEENVNAYTTFANNGKFIDAYMIDKITDQDGKIIYKHKVEPVDVFSSQTSYLMLDMMRDVFKYGTAASVPGMLNFSTDWAGKTGTSNDYNDAWLVASNPNITFGTWIGYDTPSSQVRGYDHRNYQIWSRLINSAYDADPNLIATKERFKMPSGIVQRSFCAISGMLPSQGCSSAGLVRTDLFNAKYVPTEVDNSLIQGKYVVINGKKYMALDSTPAEFSQSGLMLNPDFIKKLSQGGKIDANQIIPEGHPLWEKIMAPENKMSDDGKAPSSVNANVSGNKLVWSASGSPDVIGYRVFTSGGQQVGSVHAGSNLSISLGNGEYYVVAVDIAGKQSGPSNKVTIGTIKQEKPPENETPDENDENTNNEEKPGDEDTIPNP
ncbi:transglycosylase domain-containing protein [Heyndrickxia oleronia]|uniref:Transglycosylase domain-containing protein n=1 Tax=Heyndrickxia oleronia TaxID=38875 RepID=A0AAW6SNU2_9BACI|nr:transglycosylase domain-containing protein [Heyndrickxia oleronia]MDH5160496.1 transglycosylase domain-containing protein [Heyndrickxia oleronia]